MLVPMRVYTQSSLTWQEVPAQAPGGAGWGVLKLDGTRSYQVVFQADARDWTELIPG
jgi:hypothetical protein